MAESAESERRKVVAVSIQRAIEGLRNEGNSHPHARKQDYLFGLLSGERENRGKGSDIEDLLEIAETYLGPPETWGSSGKQKRRKKGMSGVFPELLRKYGEKMEDWWSTFSGVNGLSVSKGLGELIPEPVGSSVICWMMELSAWVQVVLPPRVGEIKDGFEFTIIPPNPLPVWMRKVRVFLDAGASDDLVMVHKSRNDLKVLVIIRTKDQILHRDGGRHREGEKISEIKKLGNRKPPTAHMEQTTESIVEVGASQR